MIYATKYLNKSPIYENILGTISKIPVICSDLPVLKEVADDTVTYFEKGNSIDLAQKMDLMYKEIIEGRYNVDKPKDLVIDKYSMESFIMSYINLYSKLLAK